MKLLIEQTVNLMNNVWLINKQEKVTKSCQAVNLAFSSYQGSLQSTDLVNHQLVLTRRR